MFSFSSLDNYQSVKTAFYKSVIERDRPSIIGGNVEFLYCLVRSQKYYGKCLGIMYVVIWHLRNKLEFNCSYSQKTFSLCTAQLYGSCSIVPVAVKLLRG